jgi:hypothetical protein
MKLVQSGHATLVTTRRGAVLWSYDVPVAVWFPDSGWKITRKKWSATTSKHIAQYVDDVALCETAPQRNIDMLAQEL